MFNNGIRCYAFKGKLPHHLRFWSVCSASTSDTASNYRRNGSVFTNVKIMWKSRDEETSRDPPCRRHSCSDQLINLTSGCFEWSIMGWRLLYVNFAFRCLPPTRMPLASRSGLSEKRMLEDETGFPWLISVDVSLSVALVSLDVSFNKCISLEKCDVWIIKNQYWADCSSSSMTKGPFSGSSFWALALQLLRNRATIRLKDENLSNGIRGSWMIEMLQAMGCNSSTQSVMLLGWNLS